MMFQDRIVSAAGQYKSDATGTGSTGWVSILTTYTETNTPIPSARTRHPRPIDQQNLYADGDEGRFNELDIRDWFRSRLLPA